MKKLNDTDYDKTEDFNLTFGHKVRDTPQLEIPEQKLKTKILSEEFYELLEAEYRGDLVEIADALGDILVTTHGKAQAHGIKLHEIHHEIYRSNMTKLGEDGKPIFREDGKILKGPNYEEPQIHDILVEQGWDGDQSEMLDKDVEIPVEAYLNEFLIEKLIEGGWTPPATS